MGRVHPSPALLLTPVGSLSSLFPPSRVLPVCEGGSVTDNPRNWASGLSPPTGGCNCHVTRRHLPGAAREGWARCQASPTNHMHLPGVRADVPGFKFLRDAQHQAPFHDSFFQSKVKVSHPSSGLSSPQVKR